MSSRVDKLTADGKIVKKKAEAEKLKIPVYFLNQHFQNFIYSYANAKISTYFFFSPIQLLSKHCKCSMIVAPHF